MAENETIMKDKGDPSYMKFLFATDASGDKPVIQKDSSSPTLKNSPHQKAPVIQDDPNYSPDHPNAMDSQYQGRWDALEERIKAIEEARNHGFEGYCGYVPSLRFSCATQVQDTPI